MFMNALDARIHAFFFTLLCNLGVGYIPASHLPYSGASLQTHLEMTQTWPDVWEVLRNDERFTQEYWGRAPFIARLPMAVSCFSVEDVRAAAASEAIIAGQNAFLVKNPETFAAAPGLGRGKPITPEVLESGLLNGTMVLNDAASAWVKLFDIARSAVRVLQIPVNINVYITHSSLERSTPSHTDRQDVVVVQCEGQKHWRIHGPIVRFPAEHQERGKSGDVVLDSTLSEALIDTTLDEGSMLYIPRGFVHSTHKPQRRADVSGDDFSTSLTIGIQTESMGFTYDKLLLCGLFLHGEGPTLDELRDLTSDHEFLRQPLPLKDSFLDASNESDAPLVVATSRLLNAWRSFLPRTPPPPLARLTRAAEIITHGHQETVQEYEKRMFDSTVPQKFRQEIWKRRYESLFYRMMGRCGFLTKSFPRKFWLPKYTTHQRCPAKR